MENSYVTVELGEKQNKNNNHTTETNCAEAICSSFLPSELWPAGRALVSGEWGLMAFQMKSILFAWSFSSCKVQAQQRFLSFL